MFRRENRRYRLPQLGQRRRNRWPRASHWGQAFAFGSSDGASSRFNSCCGGMKLFSSTFFDIANALFRLPRLRARGRSRRQPCASYDRQLADGGRKTRIEK